jgi:hypothetical protein
MSAAHPGFFALTKIFHVLIICSDIIAKTNIHRKKERNTKKAP